MRWTYHARERLTGRVGQCVQAREIESAIRPHGSRFPVETHVIVKQLRVPVQFEDSDGWGSGDVVIAVCIGDAIVTLMLRMAEQILRPWERRGTVNLKKYRNLEVIA